ncbi:MAG: hypothetical protein Q9160_003106 [Pyrenula sp. 1 TL-2023]
MSVINSVGSAASSKSPTTFTSIATVFATSVITTTPSPTSGSTLPVVVLTSTRPISLSSISSSPADVTYNSLTTSTSTEESTPSPTLPTEPPPPNGGSPNKATIAALSTAIPIACLAALGLGVFFVRRRRRKLREDQIGRPPSYATYSDGDARNAGTEKVVDENGDGLLSFFGGNRVSELDPSTEVPRTPSMIPRGYEVQGSPVKGEFRDRAEMGNKDIGPASREGNTTGTAWPGLASNAPREVYQPYRRPTPSTEISEERRTVPSPLGSPLVDARGNIIFTPGPSEGDNDRARDSSAQGDASNPNTPAVHQERFAPDSNHGQAATQLLSGGHVQGRQNEHGENATHGADHGTSM